jgi:hypothetical protein
MSKNLLNKQWLQLLVWCDCNFYIIMSKNLLNKTMIAIAVLGAHWSCQCLRVGSAWVGRLARTRCSWRVGSAWVHSQYWMHLGVIYKYNIYIYLLILSTYRWAPKISSQTVHACAESVRVPSFSLDLLAKTAGLARKTTCSGSRPPFYIDEGLRPIELPIID